MATEAKVIIKGENKVKQPLEDAKQSLNGFADHAKKIGESIKAALAPVALITGAVALIKKSTQELAEMVKSGAEYASQMNSLKVALKTTTGEFNTLTEKIRMLDDKTTASREELISYMQQFSAFGKNAQEVDKLTEASVILANVTGNTLSGAASALMKTLEGSSEQLKGFGIDLSNLTEEQLKTGEAADYIIEKYSEMSDEIAKNSPAQLLDNIGSTLKNIRDNLGAKLYDAISPALETLYGWLKSIEEWINGIEIKAANRTVKANEDLLSGQMLSQMWAKMQTDGGILVEKNWWGSTKVASGYTIDDLIKAIKEAMTDPSIKSPAKAIKNEDLKKALATAGIDLGSDREYWNTVINDYTKVKDELDRSKQELESIITSFKKEELKPPTVSPTEETSGSAVKLVYSEQFGTYIPEASSVSGTTDSSSGWDEFKDMFDKFNKAISNAVSGVTSFITSFANVKALMDPFSLILKGFTDKLAPVVNRVLQPLVDAITRIGSTLADIFIPILDLVAPAISAIAGTINWACDWIRYAIGYLTFWTDDDNIDQPGSLKEYTSYDKSYDTAASSSAITSAQYAGGQYITVNIFQQSPVVGSGGMQEFARMIKNELDEMNYFGV